MSSTDSAAEPQPSLPQSSLPRSSLLRVVGNAASLLTTELLNKATNFLIYALIARYELGLGAFGSFSLGLLLVYVFQVFASVGLPNLLTREIAQRVARAPRLTVQRTGSSQPDFAVGDAGHGRHSLDHALRPNDLMGHRGALPRLVALCSIASLRSQLSRDAAHALHRPRQFDRQYRKSIGGHLVAAPRLWRRRTGRPAGGRPFSGPTHRCGLLFRLVWRIAWSRGIGVT